MASVMAGAEAIRGTRDEAPAAAERLLRMVDAMLDSGG
jgi:hypothetical protein